MSMATSEIPTNSRAKSPQASNESCVPQQLVEAQELLKELNSKLEDCALEKQAAVSRSQWEVFHATSPGDKTADLSLLERTYFTSKDRDQAFEYLISCHKIFSKCLDNFIALLRGEEPILPIKQTRDVQSQWTNMTVGDQIPSDLTPETQCFDSLTHHRPLETKDDSNVIRNANNLKHSFADVIKAKVNYDTKFLGFEAVLHKAVSAAPDAQECFCQFATNAARSKTARKTGLKTVTSNRKRGRERRTRLARSSRTLTKRKTKGRANKKETPAKDIGDHAQITVN